MINKYSGTSTLESMSQAKFYNQWTFNKFNKYLRGNILEVGCGIGNFTSALSRYGKVIAIDRDKDLIEQAQESKGSQTIICYGDIEKGEYSFRNKFFDTVVCLNVLEHIRNDAQALENMLKLLQKDGNLILLVPIYNFLYGEIDKNIGHYRRYNSKDLLKVLRKSGYRIIFYKKLNFLGAVGWFFAGRIFKNKHVDAGKIQLFNILAPIFLFLENLVESPLGTSILVIARKK